MPDLSTPDDLQRKLAAHAGEVEREAAHNADFDKYAVLGMHAELRPYLENWASYNNEQRVAISRAVNYVTEVHNYLADSGDDGYDDDRAVVAELPQTVRSLADKE